MVDHLDDLDSDFSAIHHVDMWTLPAPRFFKLAYRIAAYAGVMQARVMAEEKERQEAPVPLTATVLAATPELRGLVDFG